MSEDRALNAELLSKCMPFGSMPPTVCCRQVTFCKNAGNTSTRPAYVLICRSHLPRIPDRLTCITDVIGINVTIDGDSTITLFLDVIGVTIRAGPEYHLLQYIWSYEQPNLTWCHQQRESTSWLASIGWT